MTLLKASENSFALRRSSRKLSHCFNLASESDTRKLGAAFAQVMSGVSSTPHLRIGIIGEAGIGKTTLIRAMLGTIEDKEKIEAPANPFREQALWHSNRAGWIRHYDAIVSWEEDSLPSYCDNDTARCTPTLVDLVEHPANDRHNKMFNYLAFVEMGNTPEERIVTIQSTRELGKSAGMKRFLQEAQL